MRRGAQEIAGANIIAPWGSVPLRIQIASPATRNRSELVFKYRMPGFAPDWIESRDGAAILHSVPPGTYEFSAVACNPALSACSNSVTMHIVILPPWWRTWWMICLDVIALLGLFAGALRLNARQTRARSRKLEMLVKERTCELEASQERLRFQAMHDELTEMLNRSGILNALSVEMDRARREGAPLVVALADLDHFKYINDEFGHLAGDEALRLFADAVRSATRPYDHAGRYGGEEFLLILCGIPFEEIERRLIELHTAISNLQVRWLNSRFELNCSLGVAVFAPAVPSRGEQALLTAADQALYAAKDSGRNRVVFSHLMANLRAKETVSAALPRAR